MDALYTGKVITEHRKELGLTQKELAVKLGVTDKAVSRWENGMNFPDIALMDSIAQTLDISVVELLGVENDSGEEIISGIARISEQEKKEAIDIIIKRGWGNAILGLIIGVATIWFGIYIISDLVSEGGQISRMYEVMITGIACLSGLVTGNGILSIRKGKELMNGTEHRIDFNCK